MDIRTLTESDAQTFRAVRLRALTEEPEAFGATLEEELATPLEEIVRRFRETWCDTDNFVLGAWEHQLIGMVGFTRAQRLKRRHIGSIWGTYVVPESRGRGAGKALLSEVIARASRLPGLEQIHLSVVTTNLAARTLYASFWFDSFGVERRALKVDGRYFDEEHMSLRLARV